MEESGFARSSLPEFALWQKIANRRVPLSFELELTARCNNDCRHCYINLPAGDAAVRQNELTLEEIDSIADQAVALGTLWVLITGGEPLLRKDFSEVYLLLKRKGLLVSVFTNACLVNEEHVRLFQKYPPRDMEVTVYGVTEETYEAVTRKPGSYTAFQRGVQMLLDAGIKVRLKAMALRSNVHELPEIARFCREHTKDYFRFDPLLHLRYDGNPVRNAEILAERLSPARIADVEQADGERSDALLKDCANLIVENRGHSGCHHLFHCGAGESSFTVGSDGSFRLCGSLVTPGTTYDLRSGTLANAWEHFVPQVRAMRSTRPGYKEECSSCALVNLCLWCPANAFLEVGKMDSHSDYFCQVARARAEAILARKEK